MPRKDKDSLGGHAEVDYSNRSPQVVKVSPKILTVTSFRLDEFNNMVAPLEVAVTEPEGTVTWYISGPRNLPVTIALSREQSTGGHNHTGGPTGTVTPSNFTLGPTYPQNTPVTFRAPVASGLIKQVLSGGGQSLTNYNNVLVAGLIILTPTSGISLTGETGSHPSNHYGTAALVAGLQALGLKFFQKFQKNIWVNDMSLPHGGLFDHQSTWSPPHQTHRDGRHVDLNWSSMSEEERTFFKSTAESLGFGVELHTNPTHWHLRM